MTKSSKHKQIKILTKEPFAVHDNQVSSKRHHLFINELAIRKYNEFCAELYRIMQINAKDPFKISSAEMLPSFKLIKK